LTFRIPQAITVSRRLASTIGVLIAVLLYVVVTADSCGNSNNQSTSSESDQVAGQQTIYNKNQPPHTYQYSAERAALIQILDQRAAGTLNTWTVWFSNSGIALGMCASKGYPIPYSTEFTNPTQAVSPGSSSGYATVNQMDPQGTYPSQNTLATWVLCIDPASGGVHAQYIEPMVIAYTYAVEIRNGQVVQTGSSDTASAIKLGTKP
jgi:hypothetical protein